MARGRLGLDRRARYCDPIGGRPPIEGADGRPSIWVYVFPPLQLDSDEPGMLLIRAVEPGVDLREFADGAVTVEVAHIRSWRRLADGTRRPDEVSNLGSAVVARDPALLPAMSEAEWHAGLAGLRTYRHGDRAIAGFHSITCRTVTPPPSSTWAVGRCVSGVSADAERWLPSGAPNSSPSRTGAGPGRRDDRLLQRARDRAPDRFRLDGQMSPHLRHDGLIVSFSQDVALAWAPGSGRIAVARDVAGRVEVRSSDGTLERQVDLPGGIWPSRLAWSPDGSRLVVVGAWDSQFSMVVVEEDGATHTLPTPGIDFINSARWSADGERIVFVGGHWGAAESTQDIRTIGVDGSDLGVLIPSVDQQVIDVAGQP